MLFRSQLSHPYMTTRKTIALTRQTFAGKVMSLLFNMLSRLVIAFLMQYCSLQHRTLFPSLVTSATGCCFCFGSVSSFFLELFLHSSLVAYWAPTTWGVHLSVSYLFAFSYCSWGSRGRNTEVVCHFLLQWTMLCQNSPP